MRRRSKLPRCNHCAVEALRATFGVERVTWRAQPPDKNDIEWKAVMVDGHVVTLVAELSERCVCGANT